MQDTWWPSSPAELETLQRQLAERAVVEPAWTPRQGQQLRFGAVFTATPRCAGEPAHVAAVTVGATGRPLQSVVISGQLVALYMPGLLALREGRLLQAAIERLAPAPDVLLVNATGRDHPRRAGLALHLGAATALPTLGLTDRPLLAAGPLPPLERGASAALFLGSELVGYRVCTQPGVRPVVVHAGWRVSAELARELVLALPGSAHTPEPLRQARQLARAARSSRG